MEKNNLKLEYSSQLDGLRFFAIFMVMIGHWLQLKFTNPIFSKAPFTHGVTLFFVLSGFLITRILLVYKKEYEESRGPRMQLIKNFYIRRVLRIFPIYYLTIILLYSIDYKNSHEIAPWLFTYTSNIYQSIHKVFIDDFNHFWSLAVEEQFYLVWPWIIVFIKPKHVFKVIVFSIIVSILSKAWIYVYTDNWMANQYLMFSCFYALALGALIAYVSIYKITLAENLKKPIWVWSAILMYLAIYYLLVIRNNTPLFVEVFDGLFFAITAAFIILRASQNGFRFIPKYILENKFIVYSGRISYGIYVYHLFMPQLFIFLNRYVQITSTSKYTWFILYFLLTFLVAHISWKIIEKPINKLNKYFPYSMHKKT